MSENVEDVRTRKNVLDPLFWKERVDNLTKKDDIHKSVYDVTKYTWEKIELEHSEILETILPVRYYPDGNIEPYKILDCGCGYGALLDVLPNHVDYTGVDISPDLINLANTRYPNNKFIRYDIRYLTALYDQYLSFDYCIARSMEGMIIENIGMHNWMMMLRQMLKMAPYVVLLNYSEPDKFKVIDVDSTPIDPIFD